MPPPLLAALSRPLARFAASVALYVGDRDDGSPLLYLLCFSSCSSSWLWLFRAWCPFSLFAGAFGVSSVIKESKYLSCVYMCVSLARIVAVILSVSFAGLSNFCHLCCDFRLLQM